MEKYNELGFRVDEALRNFEMMYRGIPATPVCTTNDGRKLVVFVGDGYHAITDTSISYFYPSLERAKNA